MVAGGYDCSVARCRGKTFIAGPDLGDMGTETLLVTFSVDDAEYRALRDALPETVALSTIDDVDESDRPAAVEAADALLSRVPHRELSAEAFARIHEGQIVQLGSAGIDHVPVDRFPDGVVVLSNAGVYAEPMAEHALAIYLALSKRLLIEHRKLEAGEFDQFRPNRRVDGSVCAIFGFGAAGEAAARLLKPLGVRILAINRSGDSDVSTDFIGTPDDLDDVLERCDGLLITAALTPETRGAITREKLQLMDDDGMLINIARGEIVDQQDLYEHLKANPEFQAGIESWWTEPVRHGEFDLEYPLLDLPNVLGCPHNASQVPGIHEHALRTAAQNIAAALEGGAPENLVDEERGY